MKKFYALFVLSLVLNTAYSQTYHALSVNPFIQNWSDTSLIRFNDNWSGVSSIQGFLGQDITTGTGTNPQGLTGSSTFTNDIDVIANQGSTGINNGGVAEFDKIENPAVGLQGSGTADAPHLLIYLNTTGVTNVRVRFNLRDLDTSVDNAIMPVALQYRVGNSGPFTNLPPGFVSDATTGPKLGDLVTAVDVNLPDITNNQAQLQIRIITTNAVGNDEWVGIDDINISGNSAPAKTFSISTVSNTTEGGAAGSISLSFSPGTTTETSFDYSFTDGVTGSATFGTDYTVTISGGATPATLTSKTGTINVPVSTTVISFTINSVDDAVVENGENILLTVSNPSDGYTTSTSTGHITLTDNDAAPTVSVSGGNELAEPATNGNFRIIISAAAPSGGVTVNYSLGGQATISDDYTDPQAGSLVIPEGQTTGTIILTTKDDALVEGTESISIQLNSASAGYQVATSTASINLSDNDHPAIVINEIYGGGGNAGATYKNDFIELYNNSATPVNLNGWTVQYASSTGTGIWQKTDLSGTIAAYGFYLVKQAAGTGGTADLPTPDAAGTIAMSGSSGKVALVNGTVQLTGACPVSGQLVDLVGYGTANCFEGSGAAPVLENSKSNSRNSAHADANNNATDFTSGDPTPKNSYIDIIAPVIVSSFPANGISNAPVAFTATINFDENLQKGIGFIYLKTNAGVTVQTLDVSSTDLTVTGSRVSFLVQSLAFNAGYFFEIDKGSFKDLDGNEYAGTPDLSDLAFTTRSLPQGNLGTTYNFTDCSTSLSDGFSFYSISGAQLWSCSGFGIDANNSTTGSAPNGVQINGFSGTNIQNDDWLISPAYDLTGTTYPLLSFWSRTRFNGLPLQLKVSTDYPGTGNPLNYTWTDLNGKFPAQTSDVWTLSPDINLAAYKSSQVHFAFVYSSSEDDGARWTVDNITITNSATPPPPTVTVSVSDIQFPYVANGSAIDKTFTLSANDLLESVFINSTGEFLLSKDGTTFSSSINYTAAEANNISKTVYVRFAPPAANQNFTGTVVIQTSSISDTINLKGTSIDPATTLEVVNWNVEWFGSTVFGPTNEAQQEANVKTILTQVGADIYGLTEVVNESKLASVVSQMEGYSYVIGNFGSHVNPPSATGGSLSDAQKLAFVYKTSVFSNVTSRALINNQNTGSASYNNWASGRYPFLMTADVTLNCVTKKMSFIVIHAKANTSPTATSYARRQAAAVELHDTLETYFSDQQVILLGDFNDDLDKTITDGINPPVSSYKVFTDDSLDYFAPTLALSLAGKKSTVSYNDVIDHVIITDDLQPYYMPASATILTDVASLVNNYATTTSDHYPVFTRYQFEQPAAPVITSCPVFSPACSAFTGNFTVPSFTATSSCGAISYSYVVAGATTRNGNGNDASGLFNKGTSIITWTAMDGAGQTITCQTTVVINSNPVVSIPDAAALNAGVVANTVYLGYAPASSLTLQTSVTGATGALTYTWAPVSSSASSLKVSPATTTEYNVVVTDENGCSGSASKTIEVMDVRAGKKLDKVQICHKSKSLEVSISDVPDHLEHGDMLGNCTTPVAMPGHSTDLKVSVLPNPSTDQFSLVTSSKSNQLVYVTVVDASGKLMEFKNAPSNGILKLGSSYRPGIYYALVLQGSDYLTFKLIKQ